METIVICVKLWQLLSFVNGALLVLCPKYISQLLRMGLFSNCAGSLSAFDTRSPNERRCIGLRSWINLYLLPHLKFWPTRTESWWCWSYRVRFFSYQSDFFFLSEKTWHYWNYTSLVECAVSLENSNRYMYYHIWRKPP